MYCPKCGAQTEPQTKFCKSCGLKLTELARIVEPPIETPPQTDEQAQRERWLWEGSQVTMLSVVIQLVLFILFGLATWSLIPDLHPVYFIFLALSLLTAVSGISLMLRGGFLTEFNRRAMRRQLAVLEQKLREAEESEGRHPDAAHLLKPLSQAGDLPGVTEHTTRELQPLPSHSGNLK
jgi:hypothetical protein